MELKETLKELKSVNDVNTKTFSELADEYLSSEEKYDDFVETYGKLFLRKLVYEIRISEQYNKILELFDFGYVAYPTEKNKDFADKIASRINHNLSHYDLRYKHDDEAQAIFFFNEDIGARKARIEPKYHEVIAGMYDAAIKYENKGSKDIRDFRSYLALANISTCPSFRNKAIDKYIIDHPLIKECKDINFLFFANYMMRYNADRVDQEFLEDVKDVIDVSKLLFERSERNKEQIKKSKEYNKIAKFTLKTITKFEEYKNSFDKDKKELVRR